MAEGKLITEVIAHFLKQKEFISMGTCNNENMPNVAPKFILKTGDDFIYLVDHVMNRTWQNLKINPRVSLATMNMDALIGYQINGTAEILEDGEEYAKLIDEMNTRQIQYAAQRIASGVRHEKKHTGYEVDFPENVVIFKIKVQEIVEIGRDGQLARKKR